MSAAVHSEGVAVDNDTKLAKMTKAFSSIYAEVLEGLFMHKGVFKNRK